MCLIAPFFSSLRLNHRCEQEHFSGLRKENITHRICSTLKYYICQCSSLQKPTVIEELPATQPLTGFSIPEGWKEERRPSFHTFKLTCSNVFIFPVSCFFPALILPLSYPCSFTSQPLSFLPHSACLSVLMLLGTRCLLGRYS